MEKFDNFGQALAWMMESPENVAVRGEWGENGYRYRWTGAGLEWLNMDHWGYEPASATVLCGFTWSRAPREPLEFRWDAVVDYAYCNNLVTKRHGRDFSYQDALREALAKVPEGTEFELILKEKQ